MSFKIDKSVPMPTDTRGRKVAYPWADMEVGDSIFVPEDRIAATGKSAYVWGQQNGKRFSRRKRVENGVKGARFWRIE